MKKSGDKKAVRTAYYMTITFASNGTSHAEGNTETICLCWAEMVG